MATPRRSIRKNFVTALVTMGIPTSQLGQAHFITFSADVPCLVFPRPKCPSVLDRLALDNLDHAVN